LTRRRGEPWAAAAVAAVAVLAACGSPSSSGRTGVSTTSTSSTPSPLPGGPATTVPGSVRDPLTALVRSLSQLEAPVGGTGTGSGGTPVTVVRPPGITLLSPSELARLPVAGVGTWQLLARSADNRYLLIQTSYGGCTRLAALDVAAAPSAVTIIPRLRSPSGSVVCPQFEALVRYLVDLGAPLGGRPLLHPPSV